MDRLSPLPDDILHLVLSQIPIRFQIQTSLISRRWRHLWSFNPVLLIVDHHLSFVNLSCFGSRSTFDVSRFLSNILSRWQAPQLLELRATGVSDGLARFGSDNSTTITDFTKYLKNSLASLKILDLASISLTDHNFSSLLSGCPLLENLRLTNCNGLKRMVVSSPKLKILEINNQVETLVIASAPSLVTLLFYPNRSATLSIQSEVPSLVSISLHPKHSEQGLLPVIPSLSHIRILSIDFDLLKRLVEQHKEESYLPQLFSDLKELHLNADFLTDKLLYALHAFLEHQPIETLCLMLGDGEYRPFDSDEEEGSDEDHDGYRFARDSDQLYDYIGRVKECDSDHSDNSDEEGDDYFNSDEEGDDYRECHRRKKPSYEPLHPCRSMVGLRTAKICGFMGTRNEMRLVNFLLESASSLDSLCLFCGESWCWGLPKDLYSCHRAASNARIMVALSVEDSDKIYLKPATTPSQQSQQIRDEYTDICTCSWPYPTYMKSELELREIAHPQLEDCDDRGPRAKRRRSSR